MTKSYAKYNKFSKISIFVLSQTAIFLSASLIYFLSHDTIICFYSLLVSFTIMGIMMLEMIPIFVFNFIKSTKFKDKAFALCMVCLFILLTCVCTWHTSKYYKDVPNVVRKNYEVVCGECTYVYKNYGRPSHLDITVKNIEFDISLGYKNNIKKGEYYKIVYLPNTKEVLHIYGK